MKLWMDVMRDLEHVMDDYERCFDAWQAGGVDGIVLGPLLFDSGKLLPPLRHEKGARPPAATFDPNPRIYKSLGVPVPPAPPPRRRRRALLEKMLGDAKDRGMTLMIFQPISGMAPAGQGHSLEDEANRTAACARMIDTFEHYPMVDGGVLDRPEWSYEIAEGHVVQPMFDDLPASVKPLCKRMGYDYAALVSAKDRLHAQLHAIDPRRVGLHGGGGLLDGFALLGSDPDLMAWMRFRVDSVTEYFRQVRRGVADHLDRPIQLGVGPRTAAFALLSGYDFARLAEFMDVLLPKHYFWHRGFDGLVGTVGRWVQTLCDWNPGLGDGDALAIVQSLFGLVLPGVTCRGDLERAFTPEFHEQIVAREAARALAVVDDPQRIVPWVDAGRFPHDGDPVSPDDLRQLLEASERMGLERFLYHHHGNMTAGEWSVMSQMCGRRWEPEPDGWRPPDRLEL